MRKTAEGLHVSLEISRVFFRSDSIAAAAWRTWIMNDPQAAVAGRSGDADCGAVDPFRGQAPIMCGIGRASRRGREEISGGGLSFKKKIRTGTSPHRQTNTTIEY